MHNPKAPWPRRTQPAPDREHPRDAFVRRLRQLGAADDVIADAEASWDDPEWTSRDDIVALSDEALRAELAEIEREYREGTTTPEEETAAWIARIFAQAERMIPEPVAVVNAWVDDHPDMAVRAARAQAVMELEHQRDRPRKGVLEHVVAILDAWDPPDAAP